MSTRAGIFGARSGLMWIAHQLRKHIRLADLPTIWFTELLQPPPRVHAHRLEPSPHWITSSLLVFHPQRVAQLSREHMSH